MSIYFICVREKKEPNYYSYDDYEEENIYDHVQIGEKIYDDIVQCTKKVTWYFLSGSIVSLVYNPESFISANNLLVLTASVGVLRIFQLRIFSVATSQFLTVSSLTLHFCPCAVCFV